MCDIDLDSYATIWSESVQKKSARRSALGHPAPARRCGCCSTFIETGDLYLSVFSVQDGNTDTSRACLLCAFAMEEFGQAHQVRSHPFDFLNYLRDCLDGDEDPERWRPMFEQIRARSEAAS